MAFGDVGGAVTELVITCRTPDEGEVAIRKGDALKLVGPYTVSNIADDEDPVFGQAMADAALNDIALPVMVRGIALFAYEGAAPVVDGVTGVTASEEPGRVKAPAAGNGAGRNLKVDAAASVVHVLL